jgi:1,4-dihydroxy-2-naphthoyl-CoA hydrolase
MYTHHTRIYFHHTDAAGRLFFANQFYLIHEAKEHFLESIGLSVNELVEHSQFTFPVVHAEADYKAVLKAGDAVDITVAVEKVGETSVTCVFTLMKDNALAGSARTVNVCVDKITGKKASLPEIWRQKFACKDM